MFWQRQTSYEFGPFRVDPRERQLLRHGEVVPVRPKVFDILLVLVQNSGHILSKDEVMKLVWSNTAVEEGNIARNISTLRSVLGERPRDGGVVARRADGVVGPCRSEHQPPRNCVATSEVASSSGFPAWDGIRHTHIVSDIVHGTAEAIDRVHRLPP